MMKVNLAAFDAGQLVERLAHGYYMHHAAIQVARDPRSNMLAPPILPGQIVSISTIVRNDGTKHTYSFLNFLERARSDAVLVEELDRVWLVGALLTAGDALDQNGYFDRAPELELVRHLRNGIGHGNRFRISESAKLAKYPANNKLAWVKSGTFEIDTALNGREVLFDFMGPGDVLDLLMSVGLYLIRMGNGDLLRP